MGLSAFRFLRILNKKGSFPNENQWIQVVFNFSRTVKRAILRRLFSIEFFKSTLYPTMKLARGALLLAIVLGGKRRKTWLQESQLSNLSRNLD
jgi:hypothetical protein